MTDLGREFSPDWVSPPGDTIVDLIEERDWNQASLAARLGFSKKHLNQLIKGKVPLSHDAALRLERVLGSTANFWLSREAKYREQLIRLESQGRYKEWASWLDKLPLADLKKVGVIPNERITEAVKPKLVETLLGFFGIASPSEWEQCYEKMEVSFRRSKESQSNVGAISSWLRLGEIEAEKLETPKYNKAKFEKSLKEIRKLTVLTPEEFEPKLRHLCSEAGVKLVFVASVSCAHVSGVARWLNAHSPLIQLSLYGKSNDKFWFTFFHEAAHILLHADQKSDIFLDDQNKNDENSPIEEEANSWARDILIPVESLPSMTYMREREEIENFAKQLNIHPGIVVGRMQHDNLISYKSNLNKMKKSFDLFDSLTGKEYKFC